MSEVMQTKPVKSWAREFAIVLCIALGILVYFDEEKALDLFTWPVAMFTIGAFLPTKLQQLQSFGLGK